MDILNVQVSLNSFSARLDEDKNSRDESREIATDIMAATTTETNPFNSFDSLHSFCSCFINMHLAPSSLGAGQTKLVPVISATHYLPRVSKWQ